MFLNFGAGLHGHEFSSRQEQQKLQNTNNYLPRRSPLARAAFSTPLTSRNTVYVENPLPIEPRIQRPLSDYIPRSIEHTVRFQEPEPETMSEDGRSVANSDSDVSSGVRKRRRRSMRTTSTFHLAHPAPTLTQKQKLLHIRPKLLLQLQRISINSRPKPSVDVLPSTVVVPRLARKFPRMFRGKDSLGCNDVMIVRSEDYDTTLENNIDDSDSDEDSLASRDLMAVICQMPNQRGGSQGKAEIVLNDGSVWVGEPLSTGSYEFLTLDEMGNKITARWVRRTNKRGSVDNSESLTSSNNTKYTFSIIDPNSRRHPIMATINQNTLDVPDSYTSVSRSSGKYPPTSPMAIPGEPECSTADELPSERTTHILDESMKTLIQVTGIWVALREGWSPYFKYNDALASANATKSGGRVRSSSLTPDSGRPTPGIEHSNTPDSNHSTLSAVLGNKFRRVSVRGSPANGTPVDGSPQCDSSTSTRKTGNMPHRTVSAGSAFMRRAVARRMGTTPSVVASDSEGEGVMDPPRRAATDSIHGSNMITPPPLTLPSSSTTTPETPTRPPRRSQSAFIPHSALQNGVLMGQSRGHTASISEDGPSSVELNGKRKIGRWKTLTNFFRRTNGSSRTD